MKEASGEANMTVITILLIAIVGAVGTVIINNLMKLAKSGNKSEIEDIARNMCKEKGIDFDKEFSSFMEKFKNQK